MQVSELQEDSSSGVRNCSEMHEADANIQCKLSKPSLQVGRFISVFINIVRV